MRITPNCYAPWELLQLQRDFFCEVEMQSITPAMAIPKLAVSVYKLEKLCFNGVGDSIDSTSFKLVLGPRRSAVGGCGPDFDLTLGQVISNSKEVSKLHQ